MESSYGFLIINTPNSQYYMEPRWLKEPSTYAPEVDKLSNMLFPVKRKFAYGQLIAINIHYMTVFQHVERNNNSKL